MPTKNINSPLPGTFYWAPSPDQPPYKSAGDTVAVGDVIGLIEVMKSFHEIKSDTAGTIKSYLVENEAAIMAGQPLIEVEV